MEIFAALDAGQLSEFGKLMLALALGALIGLERSVAGKEAGMRTFALVSLGSCLFVLLGELVMPRGGAYNADAALRIAAAVVTGIGFLGGGLIIFNKRLTGLTTAASLWVAAAIGMAVGFGYYSIALFTSAATLIVFTLLWHIEQFLARHLEFPERPEVAEFIEEEAEIADERL
jgi:putative Mg2+ transporter-C (MgtC) family protein